MTGASVTDAPLIDYRDVIIARTIDKRMLTDVSLRLVLRELGTGRLGIIDGHRVAFEAFVLRDHEAVKLVLHVGDEARPAVAVRPPEIGWVRQWLWIHENCALYRGPEVDNEFVLLDCGSTELLGAALDAGAIVDALTRRHGADVWIDHPPNVWMQTMLQQLTTVTDADRRQLAAKLERLRGAP